MELSQFLRPRVSTCPIHNWPISTQPHSPSIWTVSTWKTHSTLNLQKLTHHLPSQITHISMVNSRSQRYGESMHLMCGGQLWFVGPLDIYAQITLFFSVYAAKQVIHNRSTGPWLIYVLTPDPHALSSRFFDYSWAMFTKLLICLFSPCLIIHFFPIQYFVFGVKVRRRSLKSVPTCSISIGKYKLLIAKWNKMDSFLF